MRETHPDKKNALSILISSERQMNYTLTLKSTDESAFNIIRNIYDCFRMIGDAILISKGFKSEDHIEQIKAIEKLNAKTSRPIRLIDNLRRIRHNINYYGYSPKKIESDEIIIFAKDCFREIVKSARKEIEK